MSRDMYKHENRAIGVFTSGDDAPGKCAVETWPPLFLLLSLILSGVNLYASRPSATTYAAVWLEMCNSNPNPNPIFSPFELKIGTPGTPAVGNIHTNLVVFFS